MRGWWRREGVQDFSRLGIEDYHMAVLGTKQVFWQGCQKAYKDAPGTSNHAARLSRLKLTDFPLKTHGNSLIVADPIVFDDSWTPRNEFADKQNPGTMGYPGVVLACSA